jgi:cobalt-zinc-cadmium efflux system outer membrane protein
MGRALSISRRGTLPFFLLLLLVAAASQAQAPKLSAAVYDDETQLANLLWQRAADVIAARAARATMESELVRSRLFPNPTLDAEWGTIPLGRSNPPSLRRPLSNVPSYTAGLSELFEIGKRGPRQAAAQADVERAQHEAMAILGDRFFATLEQIAVMAMNQQRASVLDEQIENGLELLGLNQARAAKGEIAQLDVEVTEVEQARLVASRDAALSDMAQAQAECSALLAAACPLFESGEAARRFLVASATLAVPGEWSAQSQERRPDIQALTAAIRSAEERATLARRQILPDVTMRFSYRYDEFIESGNQRNSVSVGAEVPLPILDQGQADLLAALSEKQRAERLRQGLVSTAAEVLSAAMRRRDLVRRRAEHLDAAIERARTVRDAMGAAQVAGGTSLIEVLLARRAYQELLRERIDLDADAVEATLAVRRTTGMFPRPTADDGASLP